MKIKLFSLVAILFGLIISPAFSITDEELEYQGINMGDIVYPTSVQPTLIKGVLSSDKKTIVNTFFENMGRVVFQVTDMNNQALITKEAIAFTGGSATIDISSLAPGNYKIYCFISSETAQVAQFQVFE